MMRAASEGGLRAGVAVGGIRISREAGTNVLTMEVGGGGGYRRGGFRVLRWGLAEGVGPVRRIRHPPWGP